MKVYIQQYNGQFLDDLFYNAFAGFQKLGADVILFEDIKTVPFSKDTIVIAFIEDTIDYLKTNNITVPAPLNIPGELKSVDFLKRDIGVTTLNELKRGYHKLPIFIKPHEQVKQFSSGILTNQTTLELAIDKLSDDTKIMISDIIDLKSEYRCFVYNNRLVGIKHYSGDFLEFPDTFQVMKMIQYYSTAPVAYTLDVGILNNGLTVLVECNDFWSIGSYGFDAVTYAKMLRDRWFQIIR